jgi:hypothetical protein
VIFGRVGALLYLNQENPPLELEEEADVAFLRRVIEGGYAIDLDDEEVEIVGRDPFLIAYGLRDLEERCVVTAEVSRPGRASKSSHSRCL